MTADLEIRITTEDVSGGTLLHYVLHSPAGKLGYTHYAIKDPVRIQGRPEERQAWLLHTLEELNQSRRTGGELLLSDEVAQELEKLGHELYKELFPEKLRTLYPRFRGSVETLHVVSDEPWIPWELIKPFDAEEGVDDDFLCCQFELTRWLAGKSAPAASLGEVDLGAACVACVEAAEPPGQKRLPRAETESRFLADLARRHSGVESKVVADAGYSEVEELLRLGGHGIVHFVGHSELDSEDPNASRLLLADGRSFRPRDLHGAIELRLRQDRPLVFFNSCQSAGQSYSLTRLGGWVSRWILDCGCGAFLGLQWSIGDEASHLFATTFYEALERGGTLGCAVREARQEVRKRWPGNPAWLAYTAYAHPQARLRLGLGPTPLRVPDLSWRAGVSPPGALLRAEYGVVPFHGRDQELDNLLGWCAEERHIQVRLYTGAGGMGKTRLALELCRCLRDDGWQTGFLVPDPSRSPAEIWHDLRARELPSLVVVDYAETNRDLLIPLLKKMYQAEDGKLRMLLLARAALDWWEQLKREGEGVGELLSGPATHWFTLRPLAMTVEAREASYRRAAAAFSQRLGKPAPGAAPADLEARYYERVLLLHMRALVDIEGVPVADEDGILDQILYRERRFWGRLAARRHLSESLAESIGRVMALITLGGGASDENHAVTAVGALTCFADQDYNVRLQVARLLHETYPGEKWIEPILPDLLGEHLQRREMEKGAGELLDLVIGKKPARDQATT